jgi:hypothetical protein
VRRWATTSRIPTADGPVWFKACEPMHAFEPELVVALAAAKPELLPPVLACDIERRWLLTADAGVSFRELGYPPELLERLLPRYAELQREAPVPVSVPDRTLPRWPELYDDLAASELPFEPEEMEQLRLLAPVFRVLCGELAAFALPMTVQHDDLHQNNAFVDGEGFRIIDWGDSSRSHPFVSLVVPFRFLEEQHGLAPSDPWYARIRDAYLEPWGTGFAPAFELAQRLGRFVHAFHWLDLSRHLSAEERANLEPGFQMVLRRALDFFTTHSHRYGASGPAHRRR